MKPRVTNPNTLNEPEGYYFVYRATNKINGKVYIGITNDFAYRQYRHFRDAKAGCPVHFHRAIRKYGEDAFEWTIMFHCSDENVASITEQKTIAFYDSYHNGYNMTTGGQRGWKKVTSEETKQKLSALYKGKTYEEIHGAKKATKIKRKQSDAHKGKHVSQETRTRMSEANKRRWQEGTIGRKGKPCGKWCELQKRKAGC